MRCWWNEKDYIEFIEKKALTGKMGIEDTVKMIVSDVDNKKNSVKGEGR